MGRTMRRCAPETRLAGLALIAVLAGSIYAVAGAGIFSAQEGDSETWRAELLRVKGDRDRSLGGNRCDRKQLREDRNIYTNLRIDNSGAFIIAESR